MENSTGFNRWFFPLVAIALIPFSLLGCAVIGPASLSRGRLAYTEVLTETDAEQSLSYVVRLRYGVLSSMLAVSSITANVRFRADAGVNIGVGSESSYQGNLVPLSGGVAYEENPVISYSPVQGEAHIGRFMTPIPLDVLVPLLNVLVDPSHVLILLVNRINRVPNPAFLPTPETAVDDRFPRLVALVKELSLANALKFVQSTEKEETFYLWIHDYAPTHTEQVNQLFNILDITGILRNGEDIFLPVSPGLQSQATKSISMHTRSVFRLARIAAATVDVPSEDREKGLTLEYPYLGLVGGLIKVRRSKERPINAVSATKYRG